MIKSMTGFGRVEHADEKRSITVEIKAVNHRYLDVSVRLPRRYAFAEERIKSAVKETIRRGKIDVSISVEHITESDVQVKLNEIAAKQYMDNLRELKQTFGLSGDITLEFLATLPDVMKAVPRVEDEEEICVALEYPVRLAAARLDEMRVTEGAKLAADMIKRGDLIKAYAKEIEARAPEAVLAYAEKMRARIKELIGGAEIPEERILVEAAIFADKSSLTEELVRLDSHVSQLVGIIEKSDQPDGKKLDFLTQEMNREANTIGSKAGDVEITRWVVEVKSEIEKIREQVQNIE